MVRSKQVFFALVVLGAASALTRGAQAQAEPSLPPAPSLDVGKDTPPPPAPSAPLPAPSAAPAAPAPTPAAAAAPSTQPLSAPAASAPATTAPIPAPEPGPSAPAAAIPAPSSAPTPPTPAPASPIAPTAVDGNRAALQTELATVEARLRVLRKRQRQNSLTGPIVLLSVAAACIMAVPIQLEDDDAYDEYDDPNDGDQRIGGVPVGVVFASACAIGLGTAGAILLPRHIRAQRAYAPEVRKLEQRRSELMFDLTPMASPRAAGASLRLRF